jgi:hypothetical protein
VTLVWALVVLQCLPEPEREGEVALFDPGRGRFSWIIGRETDDGPERAHFFQQRPGEMIDCGALRGNRVSQEQLRVTLERDELRVHNIGSQYVYVNGTELPKGYSVGAPVGTVIHILEHSVFVVERRPASLPPPHPLLLPLQPFGEVCRLGYAGESPQAWELREEIALAAESPRDTLVYGETGTGPAPMERRFSRII